MWKQSRRDLGYTVVVQWLSHVLLFWLYGLQHARPPCPSPSHRACSNSCPLSQWYHPTISSSVIPFCPFLQSFPASGSFPINQFVTTGGQSNGASISASELPKNILDWFPLGLTGLILLSKQLSRVFFSVMVWRHQFFGAQTFLIVQLLHLYSTMGKTIALTIWMFVGKCLCFLICCLGWS